MAASPRAPATVQDLQGFKYFRILSPLFAHLHSCGTERDRAGNRQLFYYQYRFPKLFVDNTSQACTTQSVGRIKTAQNTA
jgi:hypothetical protein